MKTAEIREVEQQSLFSSSENSRKHTSSETKNVIKTVIISVCNYIAENQEMANSIL